MKLSRKLPLIIMPMLLLTACGGGASKYAITLFKELGTRMFDTSSKKYYDLATCHFYLEEGDAKKISASSFKVKPSGLEVTITASSFGTNYNGSEATFRMSADSLSLTGTTGDYTTVYIVFALSTFKSSALDEFYFNDIKISGVTHVTIK